MKERIQQLLPNIRFALRHLQSSWAAFTETDEVRALRRAFRVFWWRLGDVLALLGRLLWGWFLSTRPVRSVRAWWQRTKKAVWELPQYQFLRRFSARLRAHLWLRWLVFASLAVLILLPAQGQGSGRYQELQRQAYQLREEAADSSWERYQRQEEQKWQSDESDSLQNVIEKILKQGGSNDEEKEA